MPSRSHNRSSVHAPPSQREATISTSPPPAAAAAAACSGVSYRAWAWPVPAAARLLLGLALITAIALLATAAFSRHYRAAGRAAAAGCISMAIIDAALLSAITFAALPMIWPVIVAMAASAARITFTARHLPSVLLAD
jgi:hypothetical protein